MADEGVGCGKKFLDGEVGGESENIGKLASESKVQHNPTFLEYPPASLVENIRVEFCQEGFHLLPRDAKAIGVERNPIDKASGCFQLLSILTRQAMAEMDNFPAPCCQSFAQVSQL